MVLKDESKKLVSCLHQNLKNQNEAFINEKNQLYEFIEKLSVDFEEICKKNEINVEIPSKILLKFINSLNRIWTKAINRGK